MRLTIARAKDRFVRCSLDACIQHEFGRSVATRTDHVNGAFASATPSSMQTPTDRCNEGTARHAVDGDPGAEVVRARTYDPNALSEHQPSEGTEQPRRPSSALAHMPNVQSMLTQETETSIGCPRCPYHRSNRNHEGRLDPPRVSRSVCEKKGSERDHHQRMAKKSYSRYTLQWEKGDRIPQACGAASLLTGFQHPCSRQSDADQDAQSYLPIRLALQLNICTTLSTDTAASQASKG